MRNLIYLDHCATTYLDQRVFAKMQPYFSEFFGNPHSRNHCLGWNAEEAIDVARKQVATLINAQPNEIVFTSGATESNNLAIKSSFEMLNTKDAHIITVATEHKSVLAPIKKLEKQGANVTFLPVKPNGLIDLDMLRSSITDKTMFISVMFANNEIGVIQPILEIGKLAHEFGIIFHCDATQAIGKIPFDVNKENIDLLSFSGHKIYGPKGVGVLYVNKKLVKKLPSQIDGGNQEQGIRSGTLNVPGIVGLGEACKICSLVLIQESEYLGGLRNRLEKKIKQDLDLVIINGDLENRLPNILNLSFIGVDGDSLLHKINDIAISSGSACTDFDNNTSHVLKAMGISDEIARATLRFGLGRYNTVEEIDYVAHKIIHVIKNLRSK